MTTKRSKVTEVMIGLALAISIALLVVTFCASLFLLWLIALG